MGKHECGPFERSGEERRLTCVACGTEASEETQVAADLLDGVLGGMEEADVIDGEDGVGTVLVKFDGEPVRVPARVGSWAALREALGVKGEAGVAYRGAEGWAVLGWSSEDAFGEVVRFWEFAEGDEYRTLTGDDTALLEKKKEEDREREREARGFDLGDDEDDDDPADWWKKLA